MRRWKLQQLHQRLRDGRDSVRLLESFSAWTDAMLQARRAPGGAKAFAALISYMFRVIDPVKRDELRAKFDLLGPNTEESAMAMSIADQLHEEGHEKGLKEGIKRGRREGQLAMLRRLLILKFGRLDAGQEACLRAASPRTIDRYIQRVLTASTLGGVLAD